MSRRKWRAAQLDYLEDPWKNLWRRESGGAEPLFQGCSNEERKMLQFNLIDALTFARNEHHVDPVSNKGLHAVSCWVSLIGLQLSKLYSLFLYGVFGPPCNSAEDGPAYRQIQVLTECDWACNVASSVKIGNVLEACYRRCILRQPAFDDLANSKTSTLILRTHVRAVRIGIYLINILCKHNPPLLRYKKDLTEAWSMPISVADEKLRYQWRSVEAETGREIFLYIRDLNLRILQKVGLLSIQWTAYWDEHMELQTTASGNVLRLYWLPPNLSEYFVFT
ncbi:MAG: hypothetical protein Q9166_007775 [cf. Caloplaca sp. 2 TL-2023]